METFHLDECGQRQFEKSAGVQFGRTHTTLSQNAKSAFAFCILIHPLR